MRSQSPVFTQEKHCIEENNKITIIIAQLVNILKDSVEGSWFVNIIRILRDWMVTLRKNYVKSHWRLVCENETQLKSYFKFWFWRVL